MPQSASGQKLAALDELCCQRTSGTGNDVPFPQPISVAARLTNDVAVLSGETSADVARATRVYLGEPGNYSPRFRVEGLAITKSLTCVVDEMQPDAALEQANE